MLSMSFASRRIKKCSTQQLFYSQKHFTKLFLKEIVFVRLSTKQKKASNGDMEDMKQTYSRFSYMSRNTNLTISDMMNRCKQISTRLKNTEYSVERISLVK